ncbi:hypothetical protein ACQY0O_007369 [Thecaphora frezii]
MTMPIVATHGLAPTDADRHSAMLRHRAQSKLATFNPQNKPRPLADDASPDMAQRHAHHALAEAKGRSQPSTLVLSSTEAAAVPRRSSLPLGHPPVVACQWCLV